MVAERIDQILRARERTWAWLGRRTGTKDDRMWRLRRSEVPWRQYEALRVCEVLDMSYSDLFGDEADVLPPGRERRGLQALPPRSRARETTRAVAS